MKTPNYLTPADIEELINPDLVQFHRFAGTTLTVCAIQLPNGFTVTGESACIDMDNFDAEEGINASYRNAKDKIWMLEGYLMRQMLTMAEDPETMARVEKLTEMEQRSKIVVAR